MASGSVSSKRRRTSTGNIASQGRNSLSALPCGILAHAASFLAAPSKVLFAVALDDNSAVATNERSTAIVGNQWDTLDFGEIEKEVAARLLDIDINSFLLCIDAVNNVKRLKLTNCTNITGVGLEPLRGSSIIEQIDLSLVGENKNPDLDREPPISCNNVLPILDSIIGREGCALKYLQFPVLWRKERSTRSEFHAFIGRYDEMRRNQGVHCLRCNNILPCEGEEWFVTSDYNYGTHMYTCYDCLKHYCYNCEIDDDDDDIEVTPMLYYCIACNRDYCEGCAKETECSGCMQNICNDCYKYGCVKCDKEFCSKCVEKGNRIDRCEYCDKFCCRGCYDDNVADIYTCRQCDVKCCDDCRLHRYRHGQLHCTKCIKVSAAMGESLERTQLKDENKQLKVEMEELKRENKELKLEIEELRSKLT